MFWDNFYPNFISTVLGLILGLPIALWTSRILESFQEKKKKRLEKERLKRAIEVIDKTLTDNKDWINQSGQIIKDNKIQFELIIDTSTWDAVKNEIIEFLHDPVIQKRLAYHFSRLKSYERLYSMYIDFSKGVNAIISSSEKTREVIKTQLLNSTSFLLTDIDEIQTLLNKVG